MNPEENAPAQDDSNDDTVRIDFNSLVSSYQERLSAVTYDNIVKEATIKFYEEKAVELRSQAALIKVDLDAARAELAALKADDTKGEDLF